jgi:multidrug efflux system membrane fusion protein
MSHIHTLSTVTRRYSKALLASVAVVAILGTAGIAALSITSQARSQAAAIQAVPVSVAVVSEQNIAAWNDFSGHLEAVDRVDIRPRVAGAIQAIHFREGALVKAGDLLVTIDPAPFEADVAHAKADVAAAAARLTLATSEQARAQRLWDDHAIAQSELESKTNDLKAAQAGVDAAQAELQTASLNLSYTQVRAPVSGRVGKIEVTAGNLVAAGPSSQVLTTLVSISPIYASFDANEAVIDRTLSDLKSTGGDGKLERVPVTLETDSTGNQPIQGHLQLIDNQFDNSSGTLRARAVFDNADGRLIPGQFVRVHMGAAEAKPALLVSELAVGTDQDKRFVYVVGADHKVSYREVTLGAQAPDGERIVTSGLKAGEKIVVDGVQHVGPGSTVAEQLVRMDKPTTPPAA